MPLHGTFWRNFQQGIDRIHRVDWINDIPEAHAAAREHALKNEIVIPELSHVFQHLEETIGVELFGEMTPLPPYQYYVKTSDLVALIEALDTFINPTSESGASRFKSA